ncbi:MAG: hypothetical protein JSV03_12210 [Planctomycetota bacterium]|nr:MAG: hypothetical protein JSV03_12210 [Planctomycetota bacterium]
MSLVDRFQIIWTPFLKITKSRTFQTLGLICPPTLGTGGEVSLYVGRKKYVSRPADLPQYPDGSSTYLWSIPRPAKPTPCRAVWKTPLKQVYRDSITLKPADPRNIHLVFKTYPDAGYIRPIDQLVSPKQSCFIDTLLTNLEKTTHRKAGKRVVFTFSTWLLTQCLDPKLMEQARLKCLEKYIRRGQIVWNLAPFNTHSECFGLEEMCRCLYQARRLAERFGLTIPTAASMNNVPAHTASLGMAFSAAGGKFFQITSHPDILPSAIQPLFWWRLPDEKQLLCHYHPKATIPLLPPPEWPWSDWLSVQIFQHNNNSKICDIIQQIDWINTHFDWPVCRIGRLEDFAISVIRRHGKDLPGIEKEFIDSLIPGIASQARSTASARLDKHRLPSIETLQTIAGMLSRKTISKQLQAEIDHAYQQLTHHIEHTWGKQVYNARNILPKGNLYTSSTFAGNRSSASVGNWKASWDKKADQAKSAHNTINEIEAKAISSIVGHGNNSYRNHRIVLFNTLSRARNGVVRIKDHKLPEKNFELICPITGRTVLYHRGKGFIEFITPQVPPCGYLALKVRPVSRRTQPETQVEWNQRMLTMSNNNYSLQFHTAGGLARWFDRSHSSQWCLHNVEFPLGTYLYEMPGWKKIKTFAKSVLRDCNPNSIGDNIRSEYQNLSQYGPVSAEAAKIEGELTPLYGRVTVEANCPVRKVPYRRSGDIRRYRTTFTHYLGRSELYINIRLIGKQATYAAEAGYAFFPLAVKYPLVMVDRIGQVAIAGDDFVDQANKAHMAVHRGLRIEDTFSGMNFYPLHTPLVAIGAPGAYCFNSNTEYKAGILYATLFNNCWGTNFPQWQSGDFSFDFVLNPTGNDDWDGGLAQGGAELFRPLLATVTTGFQGPASQSLLSITPPCVELITLKPAEFDSGIIIRLWNSEVEPVRACLTLPNAQRDNSLTLCDVLERSRGRRIPISEEGEAKVSLKPNDIITLMLK